MGADLMLNYVEIAEPREKAQARLDRLVLTEEHLATFEECGCWEFEEEEFSEKVEKKMRKKLQECLTLVYDAHEGHAPRDVSSFFIDGDREFLITGGMSWGDEPSDYYTEFALFFEFLGYPSNLSPDSEEAKKWREEGQ